MATDTGASVAAGEEVVSDAPTVPTLALGAASESKAMFLLLLLLVMLLEEIKE